MENGEYLTGQAYPNDIVFPDWFKQSTKDWWMNLLSGLHDKLSFDGLWLDMSEASNSCDGVCYET
jgi:alpha-glucosidase